MARTYSKLDLVYLNSKTLATYERRPYLVSILYDGYRYYIWVSVLDGTGWHPSLEGSCAGYVTQGQAQKVYAAKVAQIKRMLTA